ncbi:MAG: MATE family efflux transporter [Schaedlerella sp.]|nr:MATE family efflux transporter [Schaedlerella sp.]
MKKEQQILLTEGPILKSLTKLAVPIMASSFLSTLYNITDMAWIGLLGAKAVAGVGTAGMYLWLSNGLASLARMGGQVYMAQCIGQKDTQKAGKYAHAAIWLSIFLGVLYSLVCLIFTDQLIAFFKLGDAETINDAVVYMKITCGFILFSYINTTLTGLYTAQGDSQTPFIANFFGLMINMLFDPVLILGVGPFPELKVAGAAVATVSAQIVTTLILLNGIRRSSNEQNLLKRVRLWKRPEFSYVKEVYKLGFPTALQGMIYCGISMILTRMISGFGAEAVATQKVGGQIESVTWNAADGFAAALNAFIAQNYGARKMDRVKKSYTISFRTMAGWGAFIMMLFLLFPRQIAEIFFHEEKAIVTAVGYLVIVGLSEAFMCVELMTAGALSGLGKTTVSSAISISLTALRIPLAMLLYQTELGVEGIWWALTITSVLKGIAFYIAFKYYSNKLK